MGLAERVSASLMGGSDSFLSREGSDYTYSRGSLSRTIRFYKSDQLSQIVDDGTGMVTEVVNFEFRGLSADLSPFGAAKSGDLISGSTEAFKVLPKLNEKCYHTVGSMVHIYTKQVPK